MHRKKIIGIVLICIFLMLTLVPMATSSTTNTEKQEKEEKKQSPCPDDEYDIYGGHQINFVFPDRIGHSYWVKYDGVLIEYEPASREMIGGTSNYKRNGVFYASITAQIRKHGEIKHEETGSQFLGLVFGFD